jgi:hypothetical protein
MKVPYGVSFMTVPNETHDHTYVNAVWTTRVALSGARRLSIDLQLQTCRRGIPLVPAHYRQVRRAWHSHGCVDTVDRAVLRWASHCVESG